MTLAVLPKFVDHGHVTVVDQRDLEAEVARVSGLIKGWVSVPGEGLHDGTPHL